MNLVKKKFLISTFLLLVMLTAIPITVLAEDSPHLIPPKTLGLIGVFSGFSNFQIFDYDAGVNLAFVIKPKIQIRAGLSLGFTFPKEKEIDATDTETTTKLPKNFAFGVNAGLTYNLMQTRAVPYVGGTVDYRQTSTVDTSENAAGDVTTTLTDKIMSVGINGLLGVKVYLKPYICLFAEYQLGFRMQIESQKSKVETTSDTTETSTQTITPGLGTSALNGGSLGIAIYFF